MMKRWKIGSLILLSAATVCLMAATPSAPLSQQATNTPSATPTPRATIASVTDRQIYYAELEIVSAAEAMPEEKYNFAPTGPGDFKGVRTFAQEVKHVANMNYVFWSAVLGEKISPETAVTTDEANGPDSIRTKAAIVKYLKDSYALGHRAAKSLTQENCLERVVLDERNSAPRLFWSTFAISHAYDHYGQMVEYLRMNSIVPPASRKGN